MKPFTLISTVAMLVALSAGGLARADEQKDSDVQKERQQTIRRLSLDITGRAPTEQELRDLAGDGSADAYRKAIDRLVEQKANQAVKVDRRVLLSVNADTEVLDKDVSARRAELKITNDINDALILSYLAAKDAQGPTTYMGVGVEAPGKTLRAQLLLSNGVGLVVNYIDLNGPSKELIHQHDVLEKLDDQLLINGEQFATLVRMHKPGDSIAVSVIREAKHIQVTVQLGEKQTSSATTPNIDLAIETNLRKVSTPELQVDRLKFMPVSIGTDNLLSVARTGPVTFDDGATIAVLQRSGGQSRLAAFDRPSGKLLYSGPVSNEQEWKNVPEDLRQKLNNWRGLTGTDLLEVYGNGTLSVGSDGSMSLSGGNIVVKNSNLAAQKQPETQPADKK
jgi:hypothetical protein